MAAVEVGPNSAGCDVGELYRKLSRQLERTVGACVQAPDSLIEDACQFAWARLVHHRARVRRETAFAWLIQTARREALKLAGRSGRELSLDAELDEWGEIPTADPRPGPADLYEQRERLRAVGLLPLRQQRLVWLYALGLGYEEVAVHDGCTSRTVERELKRARAALRAAELR
jgi:RNA polymerase sigma factor (sigma-70 family)